MLVAAAAPARWGGARTRSWTWRTHPLVGLAHAPARWRGARTRSLAWRTHLLVGVDTRTRSLAWCTHPVVYVAHAPMLSSEQLVLSEAATTAAAASLEQCSHGSNAQS